MVFASMTRIRAEVPEAEEEYNLLFVLFVFSSLFYSQNFEGLGTVFLLLLVLEFYAQ